MVCNNWGVFLLLPFNGVVFFFCCCCWWALIEGMVLMEFVVTVSAEVIAFVPMETVAIDGDASGTSGSMAGNSLE